MGALWSLIWGAKEERVPLTFRMRLQYTFSRHWRGLIGGIAPLLFVPYALSKKPVDELWYVWLCMLWYFLLQPVPVPVTALIPIFALPMLGILNSVQTCKCYLSDMAAILVTGGMLMTLMSQTQLDKRFALWCLNKGGGKHPKTLLMVCISSCVLSMFSLRMLVVDMMLPTVEGLLNKMEALGLPPVYVNKQVRGEPPGVTKPCANKISSIYFMAVSVSAAIGSIGFLCSSISVLTILGAVFARYPFIPEEYSFFKLAMFTIPVMILMLALNYAYLVCMLVMPKSSPKLNPYQTDSLKKYVKDEYAKCGRWNYRQQATVFWLVVMLLLLISRAPLFGMSGWARKLQFKMDPESFLTTPRYTCDSAVFSMFVVLLHALTSNLNFTKYWKCTKKSQLPPIQPLPSILQIPYASLHTPWSYIFVMGAASALVKAFDKTGLTVYCSLKLMSMIGGLGWPVALLLLVLFAMLVSNVMGFCAPAVIFMPFFANVGSVMNVCPLLPPLALAFSGSLNFCLPFINTPPSLLHSKCRVRILQIVKLGVPCVLICAAVLYVSLLVYAPHVWSCRANDPWTFGEFVEVTTTTVATTAAGGGGGGGETPGSEAPSPDAEGR